MLTRILTVVFILALFMMACGEDENNTNGVVHPSIRLLMAPGVQHAAITRVILTVSGRDMDTEEFELDVSDDGKTASGTISVLSGSDRLFTVTVYLADGTEATGEELVEFLEPGTELLMAISMGTGNGDTPMGDPVSMDTVIRKVLDKPEGQLTDADYASITYLDPWSAFTDQVILTDLTGIERCVNLESLWLYYAQVPDLSPLSGLPNLRYLHVSGEQITDISPLISLPSLEWLDLYNTGITDFSPLASMTGLRQLYLGGDNINDSALQTVSGMTNLNWLDLWYTGITDFSPLANMTGLEWLDLEGTNVSNSTLRTISGLTELGGLDLWDTGITDFSLLANMTGLRWLYLEGKNVNDSALRAISDLPNLESLDLWNTGVTDLSPLLELPNLAWVTLSDNPLSDESINTYIPQLEAEGVTVTRDDETTPPAAPGRLRPRHRTHNHGLRR